MLFLKLVGKALAMTERLIFLAAVLVTAVLVLPAGAGLKTGIILSGSMEPAIKTGSLVYIKKETGKIETGDVIAFTVSGMTVAHRVLQINEKENYVITKGDHNETQDVSPVDLAQVEGKVVFCLPAAGYGAAWAEGHRGILFAAAVLGGLIRMARLWR